MIPVKLLLVIGAAAFAGCAADPFIQRGDDARIYANPVLERDFPDPAVIRAADGFFYAYATQTRTAAGILNIQVALSRDLILWEHLGDALPDKPHWAASKQKFWAPHVLHDREHNSYYMYYSAEPDSSSGKCLAVATSASPQGPFVDSGTPLLCGEGIEHIDPMAFDDPRSGKRLLYWGSGKKPLKVQELAAERTRFLDGSSPTEIAYPDPRQEYGALIEAPWVTYREGMYFLFYSGDLCCGPQPRYAVMVARARSAFGPFEPFGEGAMLRENARWRAPGHNSVIRDAAGDDWMLYHAYPRKDERHHDDVRMMLLDRIVYRDGWPRFDGDAPSATPRRAPALARQ